MASTAPVGQPAFGERPKKLQRISQACDLCHRRSIRCRPSNENPQQQCQNCHDFGVACTYDRPQRRRRNPPAAPQRPVNALPLASQQHEQSRRTSSPELAPPANAEQEILASESAAVIEGSWSALFAASHNQDDVAWRSFAAVGASTIKHFLIVYIKYVYPIYPLFHEPTLWARLEKQHHLTDRGFFGSVMAACALAASRVRDGAADSAQETASAGTSVAPETASTMFFAGAKNAVLGDMSKDTSSGCLRACGLLALTCLQHGQIGEMHRYMGYYHMLSAMSNFHDEARWPQGLDKIEVEERRRIFWTMYQMDIYVACVFVGMPRTQEVFTSVFYPDMDDSQTAGPGDTAHHAGSHSAAPQSSRVWLRGWNATSDLYRILEHVLARDRIKRVAHRDFQMPATQALANDSFSTMAVEQQIIGIYRELPAELKDLNRNVTHDKFQDIISFQVAHIHATMQLVRITLVESDPYYDGQQKCNIVREVLKAFGEIQKYYLKAISAPLVYVLGRIGHSLASVIQGPLTRPLYQQTRYLLSSLANLLQELESGLQPASGSSARIRAQIARIDHHMQRQERFEVAQQMKSVQPGMPQTIVSSGRYSSSQTAFQDQMVYPPPDRQILEQGPVNTQSDLQGPSFYLPTDLTNMDAWGLPLSQVVNDDIGSDAYQVDVTPSFTDLQFSTSSSFPQN